MLPIEREQYIIEKLDELGTVKVEDIANELDVSLMTIRRDFDRLQDKGILYRSHGGAVKRSTYLSEQAYDLKKISNIYVKEKIAEKALSIIKEGDSIFLDAGTTTFELAKVLNKVKDITVITNDLKIALELYQNNVRAYIVGGKIQEETGCIIGPTADEFISNIKVNVAFLGTSGIDSDFRLSTPTFEKASLKKHIVKSASYSVLLTDSSKFNKESFVNIFSIELVNCIITDKKFNEDENKYLESLNVKTINI
ncbi:DeoR/GlpR family DNA-binding transcription regulator [Clostridium sp. FAM 1755]|uniref:DeoR/GlpR transcriptional regulator n=2 Tax=Clostridium TaxID=1485 RepID=A0A6M0SXN9_CLOBO|nr:DeoR/GlpR family DNA-binding transcription regulator [Clostridium sporogenes]NFA60258.1 DeoR/GlpR transcriptional regulator [Clostridium botulinum]MDS1002453.1 DeoR/GlpR family DNA-binding transcription regulator [Clostridium sporogenes]NFI72934.1 DeoR/GlpR transcriptional regulator [Clostridium sporogenes]NFL71414.1 DeoR/GlpR transcriptional regulator [Clostridium sporogenes]NFM22975.1 DeoR/GlpR transcriptional regulator [Clostridium sporogenes]